MRKGSTMGGKKPPRETDPSIEFARGTRETARFSEKEHARALSRAEISIGRDTCIKVDRAIIAPHAART